MPKNSFFASMAVFCFLALIIYACRRQETTGNEQSVIETNLIQQEFFAGAVKTNPVIATIANSIKAQDDRYHFINKKFIARLGYPQWKGAIIGANQLVVTDANGSDNEEAAKFIYIPFARDNDNYLNSSLVVRIKGADTAYKMVFISQYRDFGFDSSDQGWQAKDFFNMFAYMEEKTFGHKKFVITDGRIMGLSRRDTVTAEIVDEASTSLQQTSHEVCKLYKICVYASYPEANVKGTNNQGGSTSNSSADPLFCHYHERCTEVEDPADDPWSGGGGTGGGTGETGGGTGGSGGGNGNGGNNNSNDPWWNTGNPCGMPEPSIAQGDDPCGSGWTPGDGGGSGGGTGSPGNERDANGYLISRVTQLQTLLEQNPDYLIPCQYLSQFQHMSTFKAPQPVIDRLSVLNNQYNNPFFTDPNFPSVNNSTFYIQSITNATGSIVNMDYFPIHIGKLPFKGPNNTGGQYTAVELFDLFRKDIDRFINTNIATFTPYQDNVIDDRPLYNSSNPLTAILHLHMVKDGSVIVSAFKSETNNAQLTVSTMKSPLDGQHPLGGTRRWGIEEDKTSGLGGYFFYTTAVDRINNSIFELGDWVKKNLGSNRTSGFEDADNLWRSLQSKMATFINDNGGAATFYNGNEEVTVRPLWSEVEKFLKGEITLEQMRTAMGC